MNSHIRSRGLALLFVLLCTLSPARAFKIFLQIDGLPGESTHKAHENWIDATAISKGMAKAGQATPQLFEIFLSKHVDSSSPGLSQRTAKGSQIPRAVIEFVQESGDQLRFYHVVLSNAVIRSVQDHGVVGADNTPQQTIGLGFERISWNYTEIDLAGQPRSITETYWDVARNLGGTIGGLRISGAKEGSTIVVRWTGEAGKTYRVLGSQILTGPYNLVQTVTGVDGPMKESFPLSSGNLFYILESAR